MDVEELVNKIVAMEPLVVPGESAAYKRAVIRMTIHAVRRIEQTAKAEAEEAQRRADYRQEQEFFFQG